MQLNSRFARTQILAVNNRSVSVPFRGMIRREDVRSTERDKVEIHKSFRPGDLVLAEVVSIIKFHICIVLLLFLRGGGTKRILFFRISDF